MVRQATILLTLTALLVSATACGQGRTGAGAPAAGAAHARAATAEMASGKEIVGGKAEKAAVAGVTRATRAAETTEAGGQFWVTTPADSLLAESILARLKEYLKEKEGSRDQKEKERGLVSIAELMVLAGRMLQGQPYVAGTLDGNTAEATGDKKAVAAGDEKAVAAGDEKAVAAGGQAEGDVWREELRIYLTRTDCIIFVETCLALARTARQDGDFQTFADEIRQSRYRDGHIETYADRLHYTTEWGMQGAQRGILKDVTEALGGVVRNRPVNYMSTHPGSYPLMDDVEAIRKAEDRINSSTRHYIPEDRIGQALKGIRSGDIICMVTDVEGLDVSHVAMAVVENGTVRLLHTSTSSMKVQLDPRPLPDYVRSRTSILGIQVLRPL